MFDGNFNRRLVLKNCMPGEKKHRGVPAPRWNVQPLRKIEGDVYPTPPTGSPPGGGKSRQKTQRRRPPRPSQS